MLAKGVEAMGAISSFLRELKFVSTSPKHLLNVQELFELWTPLFGLKLFSMPKQLRKSSVRHCSVVVRALD